MDRAVARAREVAPQVEVSGRVALGTVATVGLSDDPAPGPSAGRVVVGYDGTPDSDTALGTAFAEAANRGC